jgi:hypothetical protein
MTVAATKASRRVAEATADAAAWRRGPGAKVLTTDPPLWRTAEESEVARARDVPETARAPDKVRRPISET